MSQGPAGHGEDSKFDSKCSGRYRMVLRREELTEGGRLLFQDGTSPTPLFSGLSSKGSDASSW